MLSLKALKIRRRQELTSDHILQNPRHRRIRGLGRHRQWPSLVHVCSRGCAERVDHEAARDAVAGGVFAEECCEGGEVVMSWVIVDERTGKAVLETFNPKIKQAKLKGPYKAVPIHEYLVEINRKIGQNEA